MGARITEDVLNERLDIIKKTKNIVLVGDYKSGKTKSKFKCLASSCNHVWEVAAGDVISGKAGCPKCSSNFVDDNDKLNRVKELFDRDIELIGELKAIGHKYDFRCLKPNCGYIWRTVFSSVHHSKKGCAKCKGLIIDSNEKSKRTQSLLSREIELLGEVTSSHDKHKFKCLKSKCGFIWSTSFNVVYNRGSGCPKCKGYHKTAEEKLQSVNQGKLRVRLSSQMYKGRIPNREDKLEIYYKLEDYWFEQCKNIPDRPSLGHELDHIIPISKFDPTDFNHMLDCWSYKNMQWLSKSDNRSKSDRLMTKYFTNWHYEILNKLGVKIPSV